MKTDSPPSAIRGRCSACAALDHLDDDALSDRGTLDGPPAAADLGAFLRRSMLDAYATADRLDAVARPRDSGAIYPESPLAERLRLTALVIKAGLGTRVYYASQGGYDTHGQQLLHLSQLVGDLSSALRAFLDDLAA